MTMKRTTLRVLLVATLCAAHALVASAGERDAAASTASHAYRRHSNNWAVVVDTSRFWSNYRHIANALSLYHSVKRLGIPDSQIILMLADQMPCNARNCFPGEVFNSRTQKINLYGKNVEVDYRGAEVTVANFITVLTGRHKPGTPASKKLDTDENSNIFIFMTGHGGDGFLKFQDFEELSSQDIADAIQEMHVKKRYHEIFFMVDTCQAGSLSNAIVSPNVVTIGSSQTGESSYAHHSDEELGLAVIDRFTFSTLDYLQRMKVGDWIRNSSLRELFNFYDPRMLYSTPDYRDDILGRDIDGVPITDFFGSVLDVQLHYDEEAYPLEGVSDFDNHQRQLPEITATDESKTMDSVSPANQQHQQRQQKRFRFSTDFFLVGLAFVIGILIVTNRKI
uniref:GPI-anchor transamidase n=2 Tax=Globisporangium ultimum (strain ATCC 200006 / CBS 805.95 / DAOM BR144) TaxID=431595 RepID=K3WBE6_GLOUD